MKGWNPSDNIPEEKLSLVELFAQANYLVGRAVKESTSLLNKVQFLITFLTEFFNVAGCGCN